MRTRRQPVQRIEIVYEDENTRIEYVPRTAAELPAELERTRAAARQALRILSMIRTRHVYVVTARFALRNAMGDAPDGQGAAWLAAEIARMSFAMELALQPLNKLVNSRIQWLESARFQLTFGQSPKKKDLQNSLPIGKGRMRRYGSHNDGEWEAGDDGSGAISPSGGADG